MQTHGKTTKTFSIIVLILSVGCNENLRVANLAERELERRAIETQQLAELHSKVQGERLELGRQRDLLEAERRSWATHRHRDPVIAAVITSAVGMLVCALPLVVCWRLLQIPEQAEVDEVISSVLIDELTAEEPVLLSNQRPALLSSAKKVSEEQLGLH